MVYPRDAQQDGLEADIIVHCLVGVDGRVHEVAIVRGNPGFNGAVVDAVSEYEFKPARRKGAAVSVWVIIPMHFRLPN